MKTLTSILFGMALGSILTSSLFYASGTFDKKDHMVADIDENDSLYKFIPLVVVRPVDLEAMIKDLVLTASEKPGWRKRYKDIEISTKKDLFKLVINKPNDSEIFFDENADGFRYENERDFYEGRDLKYLEDVNKRYFAAIRYAKSQLEKL